MITIIFSSFNGELTLPKMLDSFVRLIIPDGGCKIVAVDNGSTDGTKNIIQSYKEKLPITYLHEKKQGKNFALNKALAYIEGDLVVFTDDDVIPEENWLMEISKCVEEHADFDIFGGVIKPLWPSEPSLYHISSERVSGICYALTPSSWKEGPIDANKIWGPNMVIRASVFKSGIQFNTAVGPDGTDNYAMGSETELTNRLEKIGFRCFHSCQFVVYHQIRRFQMSWQWIMNRARRSGRGYVLSLESTTDIVKLFGIPRYLYREIPLAYIKAFLSRFTSSELICFDNYWRYNYLIGLALGNRLRDRRTSKS